MAFVKGIKPKNQAKSSLYKNFLPQVLFLAFSASKFLCFIRVYKPCFFSSLGPLMDGSNKVMESLDSLWFFNNVLTLTTFQHKDHHAATAVAIDEDTVKEEEEPLKPKIEEAPSTEILVPRCPKCGEIAVEIIEQPEPVIKEVEFAKPIEKSERKQRRRRRKRSKRKVLGELDLGYGFHANLASESSFCEETMGYPYFESQHYTKMPPLHDGLAMKEHLKSWAYAVACTVR